MEGGDFQGGNWAVVFGAEVINVAGVKFFLYDWLLKNTINTNKKR